MSLPPDPKKNAKRTPAPRPTDLVIKLEDYVDRVAEIEAQFAAMPDAGTQQQRGGEGPSRATTGSHGLA